MDTEVQYCQALSASDKINLVTTLYSGVNRETVIHGFPLSLPMETLQLLTFYIFRGQQRDVLSDANSFSQTYKNNDIIKNINQETWLQRRKKVVKAAVDGMSDGSVSKFQKYVALEHLFPLAGNGQFVLRFSFLANLIIFI